MTDKKSQGKKNRAAGKNFEKKVRTYLEKQGWIVDRWSNQIEWITGSISEGFKIWKFEDITWNHPNGRLVQCKPKFNPFTKILMMNSAGFPDFIAFRKLLSLEGSYEVIGVECKGGTNEHNNNKLSPEEKQKCIWYLENRIFNGIMIANKGLKRGEIILKEF